MKIEEGKFYKRRDGKVDGPARRLLNFVDYPFKVGKFGTYRENGKNTFAYGECKSDLVEEVPNSLSNTEPDQ
jgi:hypothetical protein